MNTKDSENEKNTNYRQAQTSNSKRYKTELWNIEGKKERKEGKEKQCYSYNSKLL